MIRQKIQNEKIFEEIITLIHSQPVRSPYTKSHKMNKLEKNKTTKKNNKQQIKTKQKRI